MTIPPRLESPACTVLIPAYNEERTIRAVVVGALAHVDRVLVVNDGSTDGTVAALEGLPIEILNFPDNRGKGPRLVEGIEHAVAAGAEAVVTLDADGQHDPGDLPAFVAAARAAPNCLILGQRNQDRSAIPWMRAWSIGFGDFFISWACGQRLKDCQCGMRLYPAILWRQIVVPEAERIHFVFETAVLLRAAMSGFCFARVPIKARYKGYVMRPSHYRPVIDTLRIVWLVTVFLLRQRLKLRGLLIALRLVS